MAFEHRLIPPEEQSTSAWSGGTTTELAIFPPDASYGARDFQWRISTAVVTAPESTFTSLPGWQRHLMVLSGRMKLDHWGHHSITLTPFEQDRFSGGWVTHCTGTGRDFNLMLAEGWLGSLEAIRLPAGKTATIELPDQAKYEACYLLSGRARLLLPGARRLSIDTGDFILLQPDSRKKQRIELSALGGPIELIRSSIHTG